MSWWEKMQVLSLFSGVPWWSWAVMWALVLVGGLVGLCALLLLRSWVTGKILQALWAIPRGLGRLLGGVGLGGALGTAHWASAYEVKQAKLLPDDGTQIPLARYRGQTLVEPRGGNVVLIAPSRSGKSFGQICPTLRRWRGSVVVTDLRGELYAMTHTAREAYGEVYRFAPAQTSHSCNLNILDSVPWNTDGVFGHLQRICHHLITPQEGESSVNPFIRPATPLLIGICAHLHAQGRGSFPDVVSWMRSPQASMEEKLQEMLASPDPIVNEAARGVLDEPSRYRPSIWTTCLERLVVFQDPVIASHCRSSDFAWSLLLESTEPLSLYLCMDFKDIDRLGIFIGAMVEAMISLLGSPPTPPRHRTLLALDEVANLGRLSELERGVSYLEGSGTQVLAAFQNVPQFLRTYGRDSSLLASFKTQVYYTPGDWATAMYLSQQLGTTTTWAMSAQVASVDGSGTQFGASGSLNALTVSGGISTQHAEAVSAGIAQTTRPLLLPDECLRIAPEAAVVLQQGVWPIWATKNLIPGPVSVSARLRVRASCLFSRRAVLTGLVLLALGGGLWPFVHREWELRQPKPLVPPLERQDPFGNIDPTLGQRAARGVPMSPYDRARYEGQAARAQRWEAARTDEDRRVGRKGWLQRQDEMLRDMLAQLAPRVPAYKGSWQGRLFIGSIQRRLLGGRVQQALSRRGGMIPPPPSFWAPDRVSTYDSQRMMETMQYLDRTRPALFQHYRPLAAPIRVPSWGRVETTVLWAPTEADCLAALLAARVQPQRTTWEQLARTDAIAHVEYTATPTRHTLTFWRGQAEAEAVVTVFEGYCQDRPWEAPGLAPQAIAGMAIPTLALDPACPDCR